MSSSTIRYSLLLSLLLILSGATAQWRGPQLSRLGPAEGLPSVVNAITQDSTGYIYMATNVGLYRYDGHTFDFYGYNPLDTNSIGAGDVSNIYAASDGLIWFGLRFGGLNSFNPKTGKFRNYPVPDLPYRSIPGVQGIYEDSEGTLWAGGNHFRLFRLDRESETLEPYSPDWIDPQTHGGRLTVLSISPDPKDFNLLWLSVLDYQSKNQESNSFGLVSFDKKSHVFKPSSCFGRTSLVDENGMLWGTYWGNVISRFDPVHKSCDTYSFEYNYRGQPYKGVSLCVGSHQGQIIVATSHALLGFQTDGSFHMITSSQTPDQSFYSLFTDRDDNLWIGTNQGALILNPEDQHIRFYALDEFNAINRIYPGRLTYVPEENTVLLTQVSNKPRNRIYKIPLDENKSASYFRTDTIVYGITRDNRGDVWISTKGEFQILDPATGKYVSGGLTYQGDEPVPWLWNMKSSEDGWVGAVGNDDFLWFHTGDKFVHRIKIDTLPGSAFAKSFDDGFDGFSFGRNNTAYLFSNEIFQVDLTTSKTRVLLTPSIVNPHLQATQFVGEDASGDIWLSTVEMVARCKLIGDSLRLEDIFTLDDGMISPLAQELHFDQHGRVWAFTNSGMNCIDPRTREIRFFSTKEGLPNPFVDPRQVVDANGSIATVCSNGLIVFDPDALWESVSPADVPVVIKQIRIGGKQLVSSQLVNQLHSLDLKPGQNLVDMEFQALSYPTDYRMEYSYRIGGLHNEWIPIGPNRFVTLPSLGSGDYTFEVKAGNPLSTAPVKTLKIHVGKPIYLQVWFLTLIGLILIVVIVALMQWRIRRIKKQEAARTEINKKIAELELKALRSQMNPHFMFNSLNSIKNYILQAEPKLAAEYLSNFSHLIRMILQNSREKTITLQEELEALILYIELEQLRFDEEFDFSCTVEDGLQLDQVRIPPLILQPYVENAIWHGLMHKKERGHLTLGFARSNGIVTCTIEDDGVGRDAAMKMKSLSAVKYKSMGMGITKDRIEIMNKMDALGIASEITDKYDPDGKPCGTRVVIRIPADNGSLH